LYLYIGKMFGVLW